MYIDLHLHSTCSDGSMTPEDLVRHAEIRDVTLIALADHNTFAGCDRIRSACRNSSRVHTIDAVEIDALHDNEDIHILAYGTDKTNAGIIQSVNHARKMLDNMSLELIRRMNGTGCVVSEQDYLGYPDLRIEGGWKALYYLRDAGLADSIKGALHYYEDYGVTYAGAGFERAESVIDAIHKAGGFAVLAHPGDTARSGGRICAEKLIHDMIDMGIDGVECWYPKHSTEETQEFIRICREYGKMITAGSDCHGVFSGKEIGYLKTGIQDIKIDPMLGRII